MNVKTGESERLRSHEMQTVRVCAQELKRKTLFITSGTEFLSSVIDYSVDVQVVQL